MGAWGYKIFENDVSLDVRERFNELINSLDCLEATKIIIRENQNSIDDIDDTADFWFALAYIQCKKGNLLDIVREQALNCMENGNGIKKWELTPYCKKRQVEIQNLRNLILSHKTTDKKKKSHTKKPFICNWKIGDTFAYKISTAYADEHGLNNRYFVFHKVSEIRGYPSEVYPVVFVKITEDDKIPSCKKEIDSLDFVQISVLSEWVRGREDKFDPVKLQKEIAQKSNIECERDDFGYSPNYKIALSFTSKRNIPKGMIYLGNFDLLPPKINYAGGKVQQISWKFAEKIIIDRYIAFNLRKSPLYSNESNHQL